MKFISAIFKDRTKLQLLISITCGIVVVILVKGYISSVKKSVYEGKEMIEVVVARRNIPAGAEVKLAYLAKTGIPRENVSSRSISPDNVEIIVGQKAKWEIKRGEQLLWSDFGLDHRGGVSGKIAKGERALSISVDNVTSVSGFIKSNDHVDILGTFTTGSGNLTITLLQNVTVLLTGGPENLLTDGEEEANTPLNPASTVTLLVTLEEAETLVCAAEKGKLTLALRDPDDPEIIDQPPRITVEKILADAQGQKLAENRRMRMEREIEIIRGGKTKEGRNER